MPTYTFIDDSTGESETITMTMAERDEFAAANPHLRQALTTPGFTDSVRMGLRKPDQGFRDVLRKIKKANRRSTIDVP